MRIWKPERTYFVTNRCFQERLLMLPRKGRRELMGAWLAKSLEEYGDGIEVYAFIFLSNHFHMLLKDTKGQLPSFMWFFQLNLGKAINKELGKRRGTFFHQPYDAPPVLTNEDFENRYAYILTNAVKARLVTKAAAGPFFSSRELALAEESETFNWVNATKKHEKNRRRKRVSDKDVTEQYTLKLSIPPMWKYLGKARRGRRILGLIEANEKRYAQERKAEGAGVLGRRRILSQTPLMRPKNPSNSPRVPVFCRDKELREDYKDEVRNVVGLYKTALDGFLKSARKRRPSLVEWPPGTCLPSSMVPIGALI